MKRDYTSFLYKDNDNYYVLLSGDTGEILGENNDTPELLFQQGLDRKGVFKFRGDFSCSNTFAGLKPKSDTITQAGPETIIRVPNGYTGDLWVIDYTYQGSTIQNFQMEGLLKVTEQGTAARLWSAIGILLKDPGSPSSNGLCFNKFGNMYITGAKNGIRHDLLHTGGWITSCKFEKMTLSNPVNAIDFQNTVGITSIPGISSNTYENIWMQSGGSTEYGVKDVMGKNLWFKDVSIWDLQLSKDTSIPPDGIGDGKSASFTPYADEIFIEGGIMMHYNMVNNAPKSKVRWIDAHSGNSVWQYYDELTYYQTNGSQTGSRVYTIPHGLGRSPDVIDVIAKSEDALISPFKWTWDTTNIVITYQGTPPPPATAGNQNNVIFAWRASVK